MQRREKNKVYITVKYVYIYNSTVRITNTRNNMYNNNNNNILAQRKKGSQ